MRTQPHLCSSHGRAPLDDLFVATFCCTALLSSSLSDAATGLQGRKLLNEATAVHKRRQDYFHQGDFSHSTTVVRSNSEVRNNQTSVLTDQILLKCTLLAVATCHRWCASSGAVRLVESCRSGVWTRGRIGIRVLRTATVCLGTVFEGPSVPVSVMRCAAVCRYSIAETYDNDRLHCTAQNGLSLRLASPRPVMSITVIARAGTPNESC